MKTFSNIIKTIGLGVAIAAINIPAQADDRSMDGIRQIHSTTVSYGDLDLSRQAGIKTLYSRLRAAADQVCAPEADGRNLDMHDDWKKCVRNAMDNAVAGINNPALTQAHFVRTGRFVGAGQQVAGTN